MGRTGPKSGTVGFGYGIAAVAGWNALMGLPGRPPVGLGPAYPDTTVNCHHLLIAILAALDRRRQTGEGQLIDLAQYESTIAWIGPAVLEYTANGRTPPPCANRHPDYAPHGVFPALGEDRWIAIAVDPSSWPAFRAVAEDDGLCLDDTRFATHDGRKESEDDLDALVGSWTRQFDATALAERLQAASVAAAAVADGPMLVADPQLNHREHFVRLDHPEAGVRIYERHAFQLTETPGEPSRAPLLGEDNDWVFEELLGWSDETVAMAYVEEVIS
jgi:benzylsuccinate CoA-transferase BbsF subunit